MSIRSWGKDVLDLLLPRACLGCDGPIPPETDSHPICSHCRLSLRRAPDPRCRRCDLPLGSGRTVSFRCIHCETWSSALTAARSAVVLEPPADRLVHGLKYEGWHELASFLGLRMVGVLDRTFRGRNTILTPIPTTPGRLRRRGYNQAKALALEVSARLRLPVLDLLERPNPAETQVSLHPQERAANVKGAFALREGIQTSLENRRVVIVDDVLTTGATVLEAAATLRRVGVMEVIALTFARALPYAER